MDRKRTATLSPRVLKPRVRVLHDDTGEIQEVRVILRSPEVGDIRIKEFDDAVSVYASRNSGSVANISIDTQKLSGKAYESKLLELLVQHRIFSPKGRQKVHPRVQRVMNECKKMFGLDRIKKMETVLRERRKSQFGELDELVEKTTKKRSGDFNDYEELSTWVSSDRPRWARFALLDELYLICIEDYNGNFYHQNIYTGVLHNLGTSEQVAYLNYLAADDEFNSSKVQFVLSALSYAKVPGAENLQAIKDIYSALNTRYNECGDDEALQKQITSLICSLMDFLETAISGGGQELYDSAAEWLKAEPGKHPNKAINKYANNYAEAVAQWHNADNGAMEDEIDPGLPPMPPIADAGIAPAPIANQGVGDFLANEEEKAWNALDDAMDEQEGPALE